MWISRLFNNTKMTNVNNAVTSAEYASSPNFKTVGQQFGYNYVNHEPIGGWFKDSHEYLSPNNILSYYIEFDFVTQIPGYNSNQVVASVNLRKTNTRVYYLDTNETKFIDESKSDLAIGSYDKAVKISGQTYTEDGDFFIRESCIIEPHVTQLGGSNYLNLAKVIVCFVPKIQKVAVPVINLIEFIKDNKPPEIHTGYERYFLDTYEKQINAYETGAIRAVGISFDKKSLRVPNASLSITGTIAKINPSTVSTKHIYYDGDIPICSGYYNGSNYYDTIKFSFFREYTY